MKNLTLLFFFFGFLGGVLVASFIDVPFWVMGACILVAALCLLVSRYRKNAVLSGAALLLVSIFSLAFVAGVARYSLAKIDTISSSLDELVGDEVNIEGVVRSPPDDKNISRKFILTVDRVNGNSVLTFIQVSTDVFTLIKYGDRLRIKGKLEVPELIESEDGRVFDYRAYLDMKNVRYVMKRPSVESVGINTGNALLGALYGLRAKSVSTMQALFSETESALLAGILLGVKSGLGEDLETAFRRVGLIHIAVLSGANITIISAAVLYALSFMGRLRAYVTAGCIMLLFALMVGLSATVLRATIMALLALFAQGIRRDYNVIRALCTALFVMVLINPKILVFDSSFQLSFLATLALIYVTPFLEKPMSLIPETFSLREFVTTTVATQLFVTPYIVYLMGDISIVSVIVNILVLPFIPLTMLVGFLAVVVGLIHIFLALPFVWFTHALMSYELSVVTWFSDLPFAAIHLPAISFLWVVCFYAGYLFIFYHFYRYRKSPLVAGDFERGG